MRIYTDGNISFEGIEYISKGGACDVPDNFPLDHVAAHGMSLDAPKKQLGRPAQNQKMEGSE